MIDNCSQCGICCCLFLVNLTEEEYRSGKYKTQFEEFDLIDKFYKATTCGANTLKQKKGGSCIYLKANKCSIHKIRPQVCREFFCNSKLKKFRKMIKEIEKKRTRMEKRVYLAQLRLFMISIEEIPIIWKKPHNSVTIFHIGTLSILLDSFINRYKERLKIRSIMIDLEMPKDAAGISNGIFIVKLHITLDSGKILRAESETRSIPEAMQKITQKIDNESRKTDRQKHHDSFRKLESV